MSRPGIPTQHGGSSGNAASRKAELSRLTAAAAKDSIGGVAQLGEFLAKNPAIIRETVPVFLRYLDPRKVPSLDPSAAAPGTADRTAVALAMGASISLFGQGQDALLSDRQAFDAVRRSWAQTWMWFDFITLHVVLDSRFGAATQDLGLKALLHAFALFEARSELRIPSAQTALIKLWAREGADAQFAAAVNRARIQGNLLPEFVMALTALLEARKNANGGKLHIDAVLGSIVADPASAALSRVRNVTEGNQPWGTKLFAWVKEVQFMCIASVGDPAFGRQLLAGGSVEIVVEALVQATSPDYATRTADFTAWCLAGFANYLLVTIREQDTPEHIAKAYRAGLLRGVLQGAPWLDSFARGTDEDMKKMADTALLHYNLILCGYLAHREVYREALPAMKAAQGTLGVHLRGGPTSKIWKQVKDAVEEWEPAFHGLKKVESRLCYNYEKCGVYEREVRDFKLCAGCRVAYYCSKECQKENWAGHRQYCRQVQKGLAGIDSMPMEQRRNDSRFINSIVLLEIEKHSELINANLQSIPSGGVPLLLVDLTEIPPKLQCLPHLSATQTPASLSTHALYPISFQHALAGKHGLVQIRLRRGHLYAESFVILPLRRVGAQSAVVFMDALDETGFA